MAKMTYLPPDQWQRYVEYRQSAKFEAQKRWRKRFYEQPCEVVRALDELTREVQAGKIVA